MRQTVSSGIWKMIFYLPIPDSSDVLMVKQLFGDRRLRYAVEERAFSTKTQLFRQEEFL